MSPKKCDQCPKTFIPKNSRHKRCSPTCSEKARKKARTKLKKTKKYIAQEKKRRRRPKVKTMLRANSRRFAQTPKGKAYRAEYQSTYKRKWTPEQLAQKAKYQLEYNQRPERKLAEKQRRERPEVAEYRKNYTRERNQKRGGSHHRKHILILIQQQKNLCGICQKPMPKDIRKIHVDHIIQVHKGGGDEIHNLRATHAQCNLRRPRNE